MKILHIHERVGKFGGGEVYLSQLREGLGMLGHDNPALYLTLDGRVAGLDLEKYCLRKPHGILSGMRTWRHVEEIIDREQPDVIHLHTLFSPVILARLPKKQPVVFTLHSLHLLPGRKGREPLSLLGVYERLLRRLLRSPLKRLDRLIVPSQAFRQAMLVNGFPQQKITVIPHFTEMQGSDERADDGRTLLFVGRLSWEKGVLEFLDSLSRLPCGSWRGVIVGEGELQDRAVRKVRDSNMDQFVHFAGWLDGKELEEAYRKATVVVIPSMIPEAFGLAGIEAMAYSKPVVAFDAGGVREWLLDGRNGFLVEQGNLDELAKRIVYLLENNEIAQKMGLEGRQMVETQFRRKIHLERLLEEYEKTIRCRKQYASPDLGKTIHVS